MLWYSIYMNRYRECLYQTGNELTQEYYIIKHNCGFKYYDKRKPLDDNVNNLINKLVEEKKKLPASKIEYIEGKPKYITFYQPAGLNWCVNCITLRYEDCVHVLNTVMYFREKKEIPKSSIIETSTGKKENTN